MKLKVNINGIKAIKNFEIELPIQKGLYAVTGQNASGKSTIVAAASSVFYNLPMHRYFSDSSADGSSINFELDGATRSWTFQNRKWIKAQSGYMKIKGFYEGSIIYGNRFRDTNFSSLQKIELVDAKYLMPGDDFIKENLGKILHNNPNYYDKVLKLDAKKARHYRFIGVPYFYERNGRRVGQLYMSTGENLLITVLHSILLRINDRANLSVPCILFLDEIELALHPSSLSRLVDFLNHLSTNYNMAIYFSTHSIELIKDIDPNNIFFIERHLDDTLEVINPCYPSYATRILYDHTGYDYIILVEDDLARLLISRLLKKYKLLGNKLVHVLPCGDWRNVIRLANEVVDSNLIGKPATIIIILDGDVRNEAPQYIKDKQIQINIPINYLPIESLEKYLKKSLYENVDHKLFRFLNDYIFHKTSLTQIIQEYKNSGRSVADSNGKKLYNLIDDELRMRNKTRNDLVELICDYIVENNQQQVHKIQSFLTKQLTGTAI